MVGHSWPTGDYRNGGSLRRENQLADRNQADHRKGCRSGQPASRGLFWRSLRPTHRRNSVGRGHDPGNKRHENPRLQTDQDDLVSADQELSAPHLFRPGFIWRSARRLTNRQAGPRVRTSDIMLTVQQSEVRGPKSGCDGRFSQSPVSTNEAPLRWTLLTPDQRSCELQAIRSAQRILRFLQRRWSLSRS